MRVIVLPKGEETEFPGRRRVADVLKALNIIPETVLVAWGSMLVTADETVEKSVVSEVLAPAAPSARSRSLSVVDSVRAEPGRASSRARSISA